MEMKSERVSRANEEMFEAARRGQVVKLMAALESGAEVEARDADGFAGLMWAAREGHADCVRCLLAAGANVEARGGNAYCALLLAAYGGHSECVVALLMAGAEANAARDGEGFTALMLAAGRGDARSVRALLDAGADTDAKRWDGLSAKDLCKKDSPCRGLLDSAREARELGKIVGQGGQGVRKAAL